MSPGESIKLLAAVAALAAGAAAVALGVVLLQGTPGPVASVTPAAVPAPPPRPAPARGNRFPAPPLHAIVFAREDGPNALALAVTRSFVQVSVVGQQANGVSGLAVTVDGTRAAACGTGCYRAPVRARDLEVRVGGATWRVAVPAPHDASALVARASHVWRGLHTLAFTDRLGSDATHVVFSTWRTQAPNRVSYVIRNGYRAIIVGGKRWDRAPHGKWTESPQTVQVRQPAPPWQAAVDANVVGGTSSTQRITFYDPRTPAWFAITVDTRTARTLALDMTTTAHFMHERYGPFDAPFAVDPPDR